MTTNAKTANPAPQPPAADPAAEAANAWATELLYWLDMLDGGALARVDVLAASVPDGPAFFAAFARVMDRLGVAPDATDPPGEAFGSFGARVGNRATSTGGAAALLVRRMMERATALLDSGTQDQADPIVRRSMFSRVGIDPHGRLVGFLRGTAPDCPLADVKPIDMPGDGLAFVLGHPKAPWWRKSQVKRLTDIMTEKVEHERRERERVREIELEQDRLRFEASPARQAEQLRNLSAEVERLKLEKAGAA